MFRRNSLKNSSVVDDFCSIVGISANELSNRLLNPSFSAEATAVLFLYNNCCNKIDPREAHLLRKKLKRLVHSFGEKRLQFQAAHFEAFVDRADIYWAEEVLGQSILDEFPVGDVSIRSKSDLLEYGVSCAKELRSHLEAKNNWKGIGLLEQYFTML